MHMNNIIDNILDNAVTTVCQIISCNYPALKTIKILFYKALNLFFKFDEQYTM